ncbi:MAG: PilZ domain-containing protein [Hyphomicrobiaceae bacterium]
MSRTGLTFPGQSGGDIVPRTLQQSPAANAEFFVDLALASLTHERQSSDSLAANRPRILALLLALQPEVVRLSVLSVSCASIANALARPSNVARQPQPQPRSILRYFPKESARYILAASRFRRRMPSSTATRRLDELHAALGRAVECTIKFVAARFDLRASDIVTSLAAAWSDTCAANAHLLAAIDGELGVYKLATGNVTSTPLCDGLTAAAAGGTPFLAGDGTITLPAWAELRRTPRIPVRCAATLEWQGRRADVTLLDISTLGAGIETKAELKAGDSVMLIVDRSIAMPGRVAWVRDDLAGIEYDQPFYVDSPEYRFITRSYGH